MTVYPKEDVLSSIGEKWLWQKASVNDGPHVQSQALNAHCEKLLTLKEGNEKAALKIFLPRFCSKICSFGGIEFIAVPQLIVLRQESQE